MLLIHSAFTQGSFPLKTFYTCFDVDRSSLDKSETGVV